jgi:hypothetical protein
MSLLKRSLAPLAALAAFGLTTLPSRDARADGPHVFSPGLTLSLSFGDKIALGIGLDVRYTYDLNSHSSGCLLHTRGGFGGYASGTLLVLNGIGARFSAGVHGGGELDVNHSYGLDGDLGWTVRTRMGDSPAAHGILVGAHNVVSSVGDFGLQGILSMPSDAGVRPEGVLFVGARYPGPFGGAAVQCAIAGRPLRTEDGVLLGDVIACTSNGELGRALAEAWLEDARAEAASIPAFLALARDLRALGAPASLVARAMAAAREELGHTRACMAVASRLGADSLVEVPNVPEPAFEGRRATIARLAREAWVDGVIGEGAAAERARVAAGTATTEPARRTQARIASEEQRHAELGHDVARFCIDVDRRTARDAIAEALESLPAPSSRATLIDTADARAAGLCAEGDARASIDRAYARFGRVDAAA